MSASDLSQRLTRYEMALQSLKDTDSPLNSEQILNVLNTRDCLQALIKESKGLPTSKLQQLLELDARLKQEAERIVKALPPKQFAEWRSSLNPPAEAWWWSLETLSQSLSWDRYDGLWKVLIFFAWTANLSLFLNLATRFLSGGVGIFGAIAVIFPGLLALPQTNSELTKTIRQGFESFLSNRRIPKYLQEEAKLASTLLITLILTGLWLALPTFSTLYNREGLKKITRGEVGEAEQNYLKAIALDEDNMDAQYNLGSLYEELQDFERAQKHYRIAVSGNFPEAYNNLARLYINNKKYPQAVALLAKGLLQAEEQESKPDVRYSLFKNLGWARFEQGRNEEARAMLQIAISIASEPEAEKFIENRGSAHCLLAQVLERQKQPTAAIEQWQQCCQLGSQLNPDEDTWLHLAKQKLTKARKKCTEPKL